MTFDDFDKSTDRVVHLQDLSCLLLLLVRLGEEGEGAGAREGDDK